MESIDHWDLRMLGLAEHVSQWSKDPSTKAGAVITDSLHRVLSVGFNGFPQRIADDARLDDRATKYEMVVHCEVNAILFASRDLRGCTLYTWPLMSCSRCAEVVIQSGITRCVAPELPSDLAGRWEDNMSLSRQMFEEAGVHLTEVGANLLRDT